MLLKDINWTFSILCDGIKDYGSELDILEFRYLTYKLEIKEICNMTEATTWENIANLI